MAFAHAEIVVVQNGEGVDASLLDALQRLHTVRILSLSDNPAALCGAPFAFLFHVNLADPGVVRQLRDNYLSTSDLVPRIFVLDDGDRASIVRAYAAGAHEVLVCPAQQREIEQVLAPLINGAVERLWDDLTDIQKSALKISLKLFEDTFVAIRRGEPPSMKAFSETSASVIAAVSHHDFPTLLHALRAHHSYTFKHSMFVTGTLVTFANLLGFNTEDVKTVATAGLVHDIGKVNTPEAILSKPQRLDPREWEVMMRHPSDGAAILERSGDWSKDIIDAALHHHERIDGGGYPDKLAGEAVSDLTRMVSIADAFSALIDKRAYKPAMSGEEAFARMLSSSGQFDQKLLEAFAPVALSIKG